MNLFLCSKGENLQGFYSAGPLPVPERRSEDVAKGAFDLEETDLGSSDQVHTLRHLPMACTLLADVGLQL